eukprot:sb/3463572/
MNLFRRLVTRTVQRQRHESSTLMTSLLFGGNDLTEYFNNPQFSDVTLIVSLKYQSLPSLSLVKVTISPPLSPEDHEFRVNSLILSLHSPVFKQTISESDGSGMIYIDLPHFEGFEVEIENLLSSLYHSPNLVVTPDRVFSFIKFSDMYHISWISTSVEQWVRDHVGVDNFFTIAHAGWRLKYNFKLGTILETALDFVRNTRDMEELVVAMETMGDEEFLAIPPTTLAGILDNVMKRSESRLTLLVLRWLSRDVNRIQAMAVLPSVHLKQLHGVNPDLYASLFETLLASPHFSQEDMAQILELCRTNSGATGPAAPIDGFSKHFKRDDTFENYEHYLGQLSLEDCSFDDLRMASTFLDSPGDFGFLELFLVWSRIHGSERLEEVISSVTMVTQQYLQRYRRQFPENTSGNHATTSGNVASNSENHATNSGNQVAVELVEFSSQQLNKSMLDNLTKKFHTVTGSRPCRVCRIPNGSYISLKLRKPNGEKGKFYRVGKDRNTSLQHGHGIDLVHVYWLVNGELVSGVDGGSWNAFLERLYAPDARVEMKVVCVGRNTQ